MQSYDRKLAVRRRGDGQDGPFAPAFTTATRSHASGTSTWMTPVRIGRRGPVGRSSVVVNSAPIPYSDDVQDEQMTTPRRATGSIAALVEELELRQPTVVTARLLAEVVDASNTQLGLDAAAERLVRNGWLLPLRTRHSWEFAPGARAGRHGADDEWIELRAHRVQHPDAPVAIAFESAAWHYGYADHRPSRPVYAHRRGWRPPKALNHLRSVTFDWRLAAGDRDGLPVLRPASMLVACAERPEAEGDWANADTWLPETMRAATLVDIVDEAENRNTATLARLGYLAEWSHRLDIADAVAALLPSRLSVTYFGPRGDRGRFVNRWRLYDAVLPRRPSPDDGEHPA